MSKLPFLPRLLPLALLLLAAACEQRRPGRCHFLAYFHEAAGRHLAAVARRKHGDTLVYRPNTYEFPPTRGRTGFAIRPYGRFEQYDIAPTDGLTGRPGTWTADGENRLRIHLTDGQQPDYTFEILSLRHAKKGTEAAPAALSASQ